MKVFLDENFNIKSVTDDVGDVIVRGSNSFDKLYVYVPTSVISDYTTISPLYAVKRADGRELGKYATLTNHASDGDAVDGYYGWYGFFNQRDICVAGALEITISFSLVKNGITSEKSVCKVTVDIKDGVMVGDDVLILDNGDWLSLKTSIEALATNLANKADKDNNQQVITAATVNAGSFKKDNVELATTTEVTNAVNVEKAAREAAVSAEELARQNAVNTEKSQRESADSALQTAINAKVSISDIINALNDTSTNKPLSAYQGKVLKDAIDAINSLLQSNDTDLDTLQELVTYIKDNRDLIDAITINKISVSAIIDNLTSAIANQPLSAKQGKVLKDLIDALTTTVNSLLTNISYDTTNKQLVVTVNGQTQVVVKVSKLKEDMDLTKADVGLGNVTNDKQVRGLASGTTENDIVLFGLDGYSVKNSGKKFITQVRGASNANDSSIPTEKAVRTELDTKQDSAYTLTVNNVVYDNIEAILSALNTFVNLINSEVGAITGEGDTTLASEFAALKAAWEAFMAGTDADNITDTLLSVQQNIASLQSAIADLNTEVLSNAVTISGCTQNIPTGARGYAKITKIGSIQWFEKQLINNPSLVGTGTTSNGITFDVASASPYTITAIGTATADVEFTISQEITFEKGHRYYVSGLTQLEGVTYGIDYLEDSNSGNFKFTATETFTGYLKVYIADETVIQLDDLSFVPQIWDLSLMGIVDGTNASIEAELVKRGEKLTGFNGYGIGYQNATTTFAKSYDSNGNLIQSLSILIDNFDLTLSNFNEACFSYYDLVNGKKVIKCWDLDLTGIEYEYVTTENGGYWRSTGNLSELNSNPAVKPLADSDTRPNAECSNYVVVSPNDVIANTVLNSISFDPTGEHLLIYNGSSTTTPEAPEYFKYEMATPTETAVDGLEVKEIDFVEGGYIRATAMTGTQWMPLEVVYHVGLRDIVTVNTDNDKKQQAEIDGIKSRLAGYEDYMDYLVYISEYAEVTGTSGTLTNRKYTDLSEYSFIIWKETSASAGIVLEPVSIDNTNGIKIFRAEIGNATLKTVITFIAYASNKSWTVTVTTANINNSLYHLGAFDSVSGNTITRQTNVVDLGSLNWTHITQSGNDFYYTSDIQTYALKGSGIKVVAQYYEGVNQNNIYYLGAEQCSIGNDGLLQFRTSGGTPKGLAQIKLATSYTEQVIEGESILPLDTTMAQMIRQDVVEGLNEFDYSKVTSVYGGSVSKNGDNIILTASSSGDSGFWLNTLLSENVTYTLSLSNATNITNVRLYTNLNASGDPIGNWYGQETIITFTPSANCYLRIWISSNNAFNGSIMLNKGSHPYPYEPYHANKHITDEEAEVLKAIAPSPTTAGTYKLQCVVDSNGNPTFSWVADN